jgi:hypothetical protein
MNWVKLVSRLIWLTSLTVRSHATTSEYSSSQISEIHRILLSLLLNKTEVYVNQCEKRYTWSLIV